MGNFRRASKEHWVKGVSTAFWSIVLLGSTMAIGAGFAGGRSISSAGALPPRANAADETSLPAPVHQRIMRRSLVGAHSLDAADALDPYADPELAVAQHRVVWSTYDPRRDRPKIAIIVIDAGRSGGGIGNFLKAGFPLAMAVSPSDDDAEQTSARIIAGGKTVLVDVTGARVSQVTHMLRAGATGVIGSLDAARSRALIPKLDRDTLVVDAALDENDALYRVAKRRMHHLFGRDIIADARDDAPYVEFMLRDAQAIAQRTGGAIIAIHARGASYDALARFADRAQRDGIDLVSLSDLEG